MERFIVETLGRKKIYRAELVIKTKGDKLYIKWILKASIIRLIVG